MARGSTRAGRTLRGVLHRPGPPLLAALACLAALAVTGVLAYLVPIAHWHDSATLQGFVALNQPQRTALLDRVAHLADPLPYGLIGLGLAALAAARGRPRVALAVPVVLVLSGLTTQTLKPLLAQPRYDEWLGDGQIAAASWPSGHAAAAMTLALLAVLAAPARLRPTVAVLGAAFAVAVSASILALGWHFPSDVLGGFLVAGLWVALAIGALALAERRWPSRPRAEARARPADLAPALALAAAGVGAGVLLALSRPEAVQRFAADHTNAVAGGAVIAMLAVLLAALLAAADRAPAAR
jgi:membrane-associated phospholipid phosphatase